MDRRAGGQRARDVKDTGNTFVGETRMCSRVETARILSEQGICEIRSMAYLGQNQQSYVSYRSRLVQLSLTGKKQQGRGTLICLYLLLDNGCRYQMSVQTKHSA